jgi:DeoR/GlpR family transcriptional regulator of sugar metabolism
MLTFVILRANIALSLINRDTKKHGGHMLAPERQKIILETLERDRGVEVSELSIRFGVSDMTIRRDLLKLEQTGHVLRTFGGAILKEKLPTLELSFLEKISYHQNEKVNIGKLAASLVSDGDTIAIGAGTTCFQVARNLPEDINITVVTNAINIGMELSSRKNIRLMMTGGMLVEDSFALVGPFAEETFNQVYVNKFFMGATGLSLEYGVTTQELSEAALYKSMIRSVGEIIVVADASKIGMITFAPVIPLDRISKLITSKECTEDCLDKFRHSGTEVLVAGSTEL